MKKINELDNTKMWCIVQCENCDKEFKTTFHPYHQCAEEYLCPDCYSDELKAEYENFERYFRFNGEIIRVIEKQDICLSKNK